MAWHGMIHALDTTQTISPERADSTTKRLSSTGGVTEYLEETMAKREKKDKKKKPKKKKRSRAGLDRQQCHCR